MLLVAHHASYTIEPEAYVTNQYQQFFKALQVIAWKRVLCKNEVLEFNQVTRPCNIHTGAGSHKISRVHLALPPGMLHHDYLLLQATVPILQSEAIQSTLNYEAC